jgi:hypothetical protein
VLHARAPGQDQVAIQEGAGRGLGLPVAARAAALLTAPSARDRRCCTLAGAAPDGPDGSRCGRTCRMARGQARDHSDHRRQSRYRGKERGADRQGQHLVATAAASMRRAGPFLAGIDPRPGWDNSARARNLTRRGLPVGD